MNRNAMLWTACLAVLVLISSTAAQAQNAVDIGGRKSLTAAISAAVDIPVIASGGVGKLDHMVEGVTEGGADAVLAASIFHFGEHTVAEAKAVLLAAGVTVRPPG